MATTSGTLVTKVSSTASSPTVNYSATYKATRTNSTTKSVSVKVDFSAWLNSSGSLLGAGAKLTIYARLKGGGHRLLLKVLLRLGVAQQNTPLILL